MSSKKCPSALIHTPALHLKPSKKMEAFGAKEHGFPREFDDKIECWNQQRDLVGTTFQLFWEALLPQKQPARKELDCESLMFVRVPQ